MALRKSDKRAMKSLTGILHLNGNERIDDSYGDDEEEREEDPLEACSLDLGPLLKLYSA